MAFKLFGMKCRLELAVLMLLLGLFLGSTLLCNCMVYENFTPLHPAAAHAPSNRYLEGQWMSQQKVPTNSHKSLLDKLKGNTGLNVPLSDGEKLIFNKNKFRPECCFGPGSNYSNSMGCNCITEKQAEYLNQRGGNRTFSTEY
jgi:hypothetical protein